MINDIMENIVDNIETNILDHPNGLYLMKVLEKLTSNPSMLADLDISIDTSSIDNTPPRPFSRGFKTSIIISDDLRGFISEGDFGSIDTSKLLSVSEGISTRAILTPLFNIYAKVNKMQKDPITKFLLTATPLMYKWFSKTFDKLKNGKYTFDPESFRYASIQSIIADNVKRMDGNGETLDMDLDKKLDEENEYISQVLKDLR